MRRRAGGGDAADGVGRARLARARAELDGILAERLRDRLAAPANASLMQSTLRAVAAHQLDPYAAADQLLAALTGAEPADR